MDRSVASTIARWAPRFVFGENLDQQDRLIPYEQAEKVRAAVPGSGLFMLEEANHGCAHYSPWHRPHTEDWLAAHLGGDVGAPSTTSSAKAGI